MKNINLRLKQLGRDYVTYGLGGFVSKGVGFCLVPILTRVFSPSEYGNIEMLTVINSFVASVMMMGMNLAQSYFFFEQKHNGEDAQSIVLTAIFQWLLIWGTFVVLAATILSPIINAGLFSGRLSWEHFAAAFFGILFNQCMVQSAEVFRLLFRPMSYLAITLAASILSAGIAIFLVVWLNMGILGYFVGLGMGSLIAASIGIWAIQPYLNWSRLHLTWWPKLLRFGTPLVPGMLAMYILTTADRWFINYYHGQGDLGIYSVGAKFALLISFFSTTFRKTCRPFVMDMIQDDEGAEFLRYMSQIYMGLFSFAVVLLTVLSPFLVNCFTTPEYYSSFIVVGILAWCALFDGLFIFSVAGLWKTGTTSFIPVTMGMAALINVVLNYLLVPGFGVLGAAVASAISYLVWNITTFFVSEKRWPVHYPFGILGLQTLVGSMATFSILFLYTRKASFWVMTPVSVFFVAFLLILSFNRSHFKRIHQYILG